MQNVTGGHSPAPSLPVKEEHNATQTCHLDTLTEHVHVKAGRCRREESGGASSSKRV